MAHAWRPTAAIPTLRTRAALVRTIRAYFDANGAYEVSTPLLSRYASSEPTLANLAVSAAASAHSGYLRTSPESAMKRLLASGSGDIYQIGPVFRDGERGRHHQTEFTMLEWYRLGFDTQRLMDEVESVLRAVGFERPLTRLCYGALFARHFCAAPAAFSTVALANLVRPLSINLAPAEQDDRALLLDCLFAAVLEPALAAAGAIFLHDFPLELRAYARLSAHTPAAERFELIIDGLEIANGYYEIVDSVEQARCFAEDNALRVRRGLATVTPDQAWLAALAQGLPVCAGVALGLERLMMVLGHGRTVAEVSSFADELSEGHSGKES